MRASGTCRPGPKDGHASKASRDLQLTRGTSAKSNGFKYGGGTLDGANSASVRTDPLLFATNCRGRSCRRSLSGSGSEKKKKKQTRERKTISIRRNGPNEEEKWDDDEEEEKKEEEEEEENKNTNKKRRVDQTDPEDLRKKRKRKRRRSRDFKRERAR